MKSIKHWFVQETIGTFSSRYNPKIQLIKFMGQYRLDMGGLTQSGPIIENIWSQSLKKLLPKNFSPQKTLILGLGAGSVAKVIADRYPKTQIIGVEIDSQVIKIAQDYFGLNKIKNLEVINQDALRYLSGIKTPKTFDLILVDCYLGCQIPSKLENPDSIKKIKTLTKYLLVNRLFWNTHRQQTLKFLSSISQSFSLSSHRTTWNLVISINDI
jgi:spermidine synthase